MIVVDKLRDTRNIKTIVFDIDGTITRWKNVKLFLEKALDILGVPYSEEALKGLFNAMRDREFHSLITSEADEDVYSALLELYIEDLKKYGVTGRNLKDTMFELEASETFISEETPEEIRLLAEKYQLFCYTNWFKKQAIKKLERYGLTDYFSEIYASEDTYIKFSKMGFTWLMYKYDLNPENTVHIGDSESDIIPSYNAGIHPIYLDYGITTSEDITEEKRKLMITADATVTEFKDIRKVLEKKSTNVVWF